MINFAKADDLYLGQIKELIQKGIENSNLEQQYRLFSIDNIEKAKVFLFVHRFLNNIKNLINEENEFKEEINKEVILTEKRYKLLSGCLYLYEHGVFKTRYRRRINYLIAQDKIVDESIDSFSVLMEKTNVLEVAKFKGVVLEGESLKNYNEIFKTRESENLAKDIEVASDSFSSNDDEIEDPPEPDEIEETQEQEEIKEKQEQEEEINEIIKEENNKFDREEIEDENMQ